MMEKCDNCKKNPAMVMIEQLNPENGDKSYRKLCLACADKLGLVSMDDVMNKYNDMMKSGFNLNTENLPDIMENFNKIFGAQDYDEDDSYEDDYDESNEEDEAVDENEDSSEEEAEYNYMVSSNEQTDDEALTNTPDNQKGAKTAGVKTRKRRRTLGKALRKFGTNLIDKAVAGEVDQIIGRDKEIDRVVQILNRRQKNNPLLIGEPGVGKTAIAEGLAVRIVEQRVPQKLLGAEIVLLDLMAVVAGTQFRGQFEQRMKDIIADANKAGNVILVIDELHNIMGAGEVHGGVMNAANILKPALAKGEVQVMGATTLEEYRRHIEKDSALERRFQPVRVEEPSVEEAIEILEGIKFYYELFHRVRIPTEVVEAAVRMSARYITDRFLPDKAIDVLDEAGSRKNLLNLGLVEQKKLTDEFEQLVSEHADASADGHYEKAAELRAEFLRIKEEIDEMDKINSQVEIEIADLAYVIEAWTGIPVKKITEEESAKLLDLENRLHRRVISQDKAVQAVAKAVRRNRSGFRKLRKPASFIFVGPTGVGKTELAKALASELFGNDDAMIRLDMSEFMEKHTVSKLIGAPPGYVGFDEGGQLTELVRRKPYSVILLDEIEKAHPDVFNMLLQILDDGRLTDNRGRTTFFENTVIIMTSNVGTASSGAGLGFSSKPDSSRAAEFVKAKLAEVFRPEFLNRIDETVVFDPLTEADLSQIFELLIAEVDEALADKGMDLRIDDPARKFLLQEGFDPKFGARPLRRVIQRYIEDEIAELYIRKEVVDGDSLLATLVCADAKNKNPEDGKTPPQKILITKDKGNNE